MSEMMDCLNRLVDRQTNEIYRKTYQKQLDNDIVESILQYSLPKTEATVCAITSKMLEELERGYELSVDDAAQCVLNDYQCMLSDIDSFLGKDWRVRLTKERCKCPIFEESCHCGASNGK